jgi:voltage-gated potassium channel
MVLNNKSELSVWQVLLLILSVLILISILIDTVAPLNHEVSKVIQFYDFFVCILFFIDFVARLLKSDKKIKFFFLQWGWLDLLSSVPMVDFLRYGRVIRIVRIIRILRALRSFKFIFSILYSNRPKSTFFTVILISFLLLFVSSIAILNFENASQSNIKTAEDALWWGFTTITTVGYGDRFPVTSAGRIVGVFLMIAGVGIFGTLSGFIASWFLGKPEDTKST